MVTVEVNGLGDVLGLPDRSVGRGRSRIGRRPGPRRRQRGAGRAKLLHAEAMRSMTAGMDLPGLDEMLAQVDRPAESAGRRPESLRIRSARSLAAWLPSRPLRKRSAGLVAQLSESLTKLVDEFAKLPGIGRKSAERLAYHVLRIHKTEALALADAIRNVKENVRYCRVCYNLAEAEECAICPDPRRDQTLLCVVEQPRDLIALEQAGTYRGLYHVLLGRLAPLEGIGPEQLTLDPLVERVRGGQFREVIMGTNPTLEGDGTALYISNLLADYAGRDHAAGPGHHDRQRARICQ